MLRVNIEHMSDAVDPAVDQERSSAKASPSPQHADRSMDLSTSPMNQNYGQLHIFDITEVNT